MSTGTAPRTGLTARRPFPDRLGPPGNLIYKLVTTTDHKLIGIMYVVTCFGFFFVGGRLHHRGVHPRGVDAAVYLERVQKLALRRAGGSG